MSSVLRIVDLPVGAGRRRVTVRLERPGAAPREAVAPFGYAPDEGDAELVRWYLEDYAEFPADPAPAIAGRAEARLAAVGRDLFGKVFRSGGPASLWTLATSAAGGLSGLRVEVDADPADVPGLPWELLRESGTGGPVVLAAGGFVRIHLQSAREAWLPEPSGDHLRVLLVICRPGGRDDVPFRSVASRLVRGGAQQVDGLDLDVLRPPTYARLAQVLREAADAGRPYHVVHFDGHGTFLDATTLTADGDDTGQGMGAGTGAGGVGVSPWLYGVSVAGPVRSGRHGYLLFEDPTAAENQQLVDGATLGALLNETQVPVLVLNACRSAYTEAPTSPRAGDDTDVSGASDPGDVVVARSGGGGAVAEAGLVDVDAGDVHARVRAYGSLAAEVADAGVPGVVAMRYNVYVVTAAQFVADLYTHLLAGKTLGQAATAARKALADDPTRLVGATAVALQDWTVPTVYEAAPLTLLRPATREMPRRIHVDVGDATTGDVAAGPEVGVPKAPDVGFFGRDETLLALDRAFDTNPIVLLHAYAGAGKSTTAAEFARWYHATGGLDDPRFGAGAVVWTSFEQHLPLPRVLDAVGDVFAGLLEASGIHWQAITDDATRRGVVLQVLAQVPVLWVWDNVEPVAGFPAGAPSAWTETEQDELVEFLRDLATKTRCRVLLTSRRDELAWLGDLPVRVKLPPMPMRERLQLTHALAARHRPGQPAPEVDWRPLLRYTGGNPLTVTVTVRQALREQLETTAEIDAYVQRLHAGETPLESEEDSALGRTRSLAASLGYGFTHAFTDAERAQLALLHLFRDTVDVDALRIMGNPNIAGDDAVPALAGLTRETGIALLDRAAEIGLLTDYDRGYYGIHPALPWYFTTLYTHHHATPGTPAAEASERAYTHALGDLGNYYYGQAGAGRAADVVPTLAAEEANLLHALHLARTHNLPDAEIGCLQGLRTLYAQTGRSAEWARLVELVTPDYLDPTTETPLPGREDHYTHITGYRVDIARAARDWPTATRLQQARITWTRRRAAPYLDIPADQLDDTGRYRIHNLANAVEGYGALLRYQRDASCLPHLQEALNLYQRIGSTEGEAIVAGSIGTAHINVPALRDLDQAQYWHQYSLDHKPEHDRVGRAASHGQLGNIAYARYEDARDAGATEATRLEHLNTALAGYQQALALTPPHHAEYLAVVQNQLGLIYAQAGNTTDALRHYQQSIKHELDRGNTFGAGQTRHNIAILLAQNGRYDDALQYANAALTNYRDIGPSATSNATQVQSLITHLQQQ